MSCIKFPTSKNDFSRSSTRENNDYTSAVNSQLITIANLEFGQGNWSHSISNQTVDFTDYVSGKYQAGCVSIVKVQLKDGAFHEDLGYSNTEGSTKGSAIQKARLSSYNCAFKRALSCFGNDIFNKINRLSNRAQSPRPIELNNINNNGCNIPNVKNNPVPSVSIKAEVEVDPPPEEEKQFEQCMEAISLSQSDVFMNNIDLDKIFAKEGKEGSHKNISTITATIPLNGTISKDENTRTNTVNDIISTDPTRPTTSAAVKVQVNGIDTSKNNITDLANKPKSISKPIVATAMTEEEMRLERKRKQREKQEEFKRNHESKKMCSDNGGKANPRF